MKVPIKAIVVLACLCASNGAAAAPKPGDFFLISRNRHGEFVGGHKLFAEYTDGLNKVSYCKRQFYVRSETVAWTEIEADRGNVVKIEYNSGRGWLPICGAPEQQVTLKDIGIELSAEDLLNAQHKDLKWHSQLSSIGSMFKW